MSNARDMMDKFESRIGWSVEREGDKYFLAWAYGCMLICPAHWPHTIAIDAACEFMDRFREDNVPRNCATPGDLMRFCVGEARRQR